MIEGLNIWAKSIVLAVIIVAILEMLLPNNKTKKYVKVVMGIFVLYNIISPFIKDNSISFAKFDINNYTSEINNSTEINQEAMDRRLEQLYIQELEKDISKKIEKRGYIVKLCKVKAKISNDEKKTGIQKINLKLEKNENFEIKDEDSEELENTIVSEIQNIKKINTKIQDSKKEESQKLDKVDIQNIKKFLIEEYEVNEKCLEIN